MPESYKNLSVIFQKESGQKDWFNELLKTRSVDEISEVCGCTGRTVRDWRNGKYRMNLECLERLCKKYVLQKPSVKTVSRYAHTNEAGAKGAKAMLKKYGRVPVNEKVRKEKWNEWWEREGKYTTKIVQPRSVVFPKKYTAELAEFVGILMGDGGMSKYQLIVTLHAHDDKEYGLFVADLIEKLFSVPVSILPRKDVQATDHVVSRKELVEFCVNDLGLRIGNKLSMPLTIPSWIKANKQFTKACVRGLFDTDGSVYPHSYLVKGKKYVYKKICFTSASPQLVKEVVEFLEGEGITTSCFGRNVRIENQTSVRLYLRKIGFHNPKHLKRLQK